VDRGIGVQSTRMLISTESEVCQCGGILILVRRIWEGGGVVLDEPDGTVLKFSVELCCSAEGAREILTYCDYEQPAFAIPVWTNS